VRHVEAPAHLPILDAVPRFDAVDRQRQRRRVGLVEARPALPVDLALDDSAECIGIDVRRVQIHSEADLDRRLRGVDLETGHGVCSSSAVV
jgi:hypothetical protein